MLSRTPLVISTFSYLASAISRSFFVMLSTRKPDSDFRRLVRNGAFQMLFCFSFRVVTFLSLAQNFVRAFYRPFGTSFVIF
jgi:hypothetical protein